MENLQSKAAIASNIRHLHPLYLSWIWLLYRMLAASGRQMLILQHLQRKLYRRLL